MDAQEMPPGDGGAEQVVYELTPSGTWLRVRAGDRYQAPRFERSDVPFVEQQGREVAHDSRRFAPARRAGTAPRQFA